LGAVSTASTTTAGLLVVTNEAAGRTHADSIAAVMEALAAGGRVEVGTCREEADLDGILDRRGDRTLVVVGGDGSLHTMVTHLWRRGEAERSPIGLIPLGTGNDFARGVGVPLDAEQAAQVVLKGVPRPMDLITDDAGGVVVNAVHVGVGAEAAVRARPLKRFLKVGAFPLGGLIAGLRSPGWRLRIEVDGRVVADGRRKVLMAGVSNAPTIAGATATLGPAATPTDGLVNVTVSVATGPLARIGYAIKLIRGTHPERPDVRYLPGRTVTVRGEAFTTNADGEVSEPIRARTWTVQPGAWRCIVPDNSAAPGGAVLAATLPSVPSR
jgi:diacylglycerol kinase (ATP)